MASTPILPRIRSTRRPYSMGRPLRFGPNPRTGQMGLHRYATSNTKSPYACFTIQPRCLPTCIYPLALVIPNDYSGQLTAVLRYPPPPPNAPVPIPHVNLLLRQAIAVRSKPDPSAGVTCVMENRDFLGISADPPEPAQRGGGRGRGSGGSRGRGRGVQSNNHGNNGPPTPGGMLSDALANRLMDVNSAVFSTVSELRVGLILYIFTV